MSNEKFFDVKGITAGYENKLIIRDINFELKQGTLTALLGANGSGKSTLLKSIANELPHKGSCILKGKSLESLSVKKIARTVSYMPQKSGIHISLPVLDVVLMGFNPVLKLLERPSNNQRVLAKEALKKVGLKGIDSVDYLNLSEGQKQLVFLARTMIEDTFLLLLDEPDSALDFQNRHLILKKLKDLVQSGEKTGLLCLHDPSLALDYCEQLLIMREGRIVQCVDPQKDNLLEIEKALQQIYGNVSIAECKDKKGRRHLVLIWEDEE